MRNAFATVLGLSLLLGGCGSSRIDGSAVISPRTTARLDVNGSNPEISIRNTSAVSVPVELGTGEMGREKATLEPGVTRLWNPDGPRSVWFYNQTDASVSVEYTITGGGMSFTMPVK